LINRQDNFNRRDEIIAVAGFMFSSARNSKIQAAGRLQFEASFQAAGL